MRSAVRLAEGGYLVCNLGMKNSVTQMTLDDIKREVQSISSIASDSEGAHEKEDALYVQFIEFVAGHSDQELAGMARAVLATKEISFPRRTA